MDPIAIDRLARLVAHGGTRRTLGRLLLGVPLVAGLLPPLAAGLVTAADDDHGSSHRRRRRNTRHKHRKNTVRRNKKHKPNKPQRQCRPISCPGDPLCGAQPDGCGGTLSCGCSGTRRCVDGTCQPPRCGPTNPCPTGQCCGADGACGACLVFVTSQTYLGNLGGLTGGDDKCQHLAATAGLPGEYLAWLSDTTGSPSTRFVRATVPYRRTDGVTLADNWDDLIAHFPDGPLNVTETGDPAPGVLVWTGTDRNGNLGGSYRGFPNSHCSNWAEPSGGGVYGQSNWPTNTSIWTSQSSANCDGSLAGPLPLYCFQQR